MSLGSKRLLHHQGRCFSLHQHRRSLSFFRDSLPQDLSERKPYPKSGGLVEDITIATVLETIVSRVPRKGPPLSLQEACPESERSSLWKNVFDRRNGFDLKPDRPFGDWLNYVDMVSPVIKAKNSALVIRKIVQIVDLKDEAQLDWIDIKLSFANIVDVLAKMKTPAAAFVFYKWLKDQSYYVPDKSVYRALIDRLIQWIDSSHWDRLQVVISDMIESQTAVDSKQFGRIFALVQAAKHIKLLRLQLYVHWLLKMRSLGLEPWYSTYEKVMKMCNKLELYDCTISIFKCIPANTYGWAFTLAFSACKHTGNMCLAEELFREMKQQNMDLDVKCCNDLLALYISHEEADRAKILLDDMKSIGASVNFANRLALGTSFGGLLNNYVEEILPATKEESSALVEKFIRILDSNNDAQLHFVNIKLCFEDVLYILTNVKNPTAAFVFYKWVRERSFYVPEKSIYTALIDRLVASTDVDTWERVHFVIEDMIENKTSTDSKQFSELLAFVKTSKPIDTLKMQLYVEWLLEMINLGLEPWFSTYEKAMHLCNELELYDTAISIFRAIPANSYPWAFAQALCSCKFMDNIELAEELLSEMKMKNMMVDPKCYNYLLTLYASHGLADKAKSLLEEMKQPGVTLDSRPFTSVIHALGKLGRVREAEDIFQRLERVDLDAGIYRAMAACYREAGHFNELLTLLRQGNGSRIGATCFASAFEACVEKSEVKVAVEIMKDMLKWGMSPAPRLYRPILQVCSELNDYSVCRKLDFNLREIDELSLEDLERAIKMYVSSNKVSAILDALEIMNERELGPPTAELFEFCIRMLSETSLQDAMKMYRVMRSVGYVPSSSLFTTLIERQSATEKMLDCKQCADNNATDSCQLEDLVASLVLPSVRM